MAPRHGALPAAFRGPVTWWEENKTWVVALGVPGALSAAARILWGRLVTKQDLEISELKAKNLALEAKLEASEQRHMKTALTLERLLGKLESGHARSSSRPPS